MAHRNFRVACCEYFACADEAYGKAVFWHCLHGGAYVPAKFLSRLSPAVFAPDFQMIQAVATASNLAELEEELNRFLRTTPPVGLLRRTMQIRVSARRILDLAGVVFPASVPAHGESKETEFFLRRIDDSSRASLSRS